MQEIENVNHEKDEFQATKVKTKFSVLHFLS